MIKKILSETEWKKEKIQAKIIDSFRSGAFLAWDDNKKREHLVSYYKNNKNEYIACYMKTFNIKFRNNTIQLTNHLLHDEKALSKEFDDAEFDIDQTKAFCPAWILLKNRPKNTHLSEGISVYIGDMCIHYRSIMDVLFIPWSQYNGIGRENKWMSIEDSQDYKEIYWAKLAEYYDTHYHFQEEHARKYVELIIKYLLKLKMQKTAKILSIGSGTGIIENEFAKKGYNNITLTDQSEEMLKRALQKKTLKKAKAITTLMEDFNPKEKYDMIITFNTFCWIECKDIARLCHHNLKGGGIFITDEDGPVMRPDENKDYYETKDIGLNRIIAIGPESKKWNKIKQPLYIYQKKSR